MALKKSVSSTIVEVEHTLTILKQEAAKDPSIEAQYAKKLAAVVDLLSIKDGVTKDLNQAYTYGKNWWANNVTDGNLEGCTLENRLEKIKEHVLKSSAYSRHFNTPATKGKVEKWLRETFAAPAQPQQKAA